MRIALIVGHTDLHEGAKCSAPFQFLTEYKYNSVLAAMIKMRALDLKVICQVFFRDHVGIRDCYKAVAEFKADAAIELHYNSFGSNSVKGSETLYGNNPQAEEFARYVHESMVSGLFREKKEDRGIKHLTEGSRGYWNVNGATDIPTVIIEPFFGSNLEEVKLALSDMNHLSKAILDGALSWWSR